MCKIVGFALTFLSLIFSSLSFADEKLPMEGVVLKIAVDPQSAPISYIKDDFAHPIGMDIDIIQELSKRLGFTLEDDRLYVLDRTSAINCLQKGIVDIVAGGLATTEERRKLMEFSPVYYQTGLGILYSKVHTKNKVNLGSLSGKKVAVVKDSPAFVYLNSIFKDSIEIVPIANLTLGYFMVAYGKVVALVHDYPMIKDFAGTMPSLNLVLSGDIFSLESGQIGFGYGKDFKYKMQMNMGIREMMNDGQMQKIINKWIRRR